jgi:hypothetical protein
MIDLFGNFDGLVKSRKSLKTSFRRKPESSDFSMFWMPDQVRHDELGLPTKSFLLIHRCYRVTTSNYMIFKITCS